MQRHDLHGIVRHGAGIRVMFEQHPRHSFVPEECREVQGSESIAGSAFASRDCA